MQVYYTPEITEIKQAAYNLRFRAANMAETIEELGKAKSVKDAEYLWNAYMHAMKAKTTQNFDESYNIVRDNINYWLERFTENNSQLRQHYKSIENFVFNPDMGFVTYINNSDYIATRDDIMDKQTNIMADFLGRADSARTDAADARKRTPEQQISYEIGYEEGFAKGFDVGYTEGVEQVLEVLEEVVRLVRKDPVINLGKKS